MGVSSMAAAKRRLFSAFHFSRKLALITGGFLVLLGASGTATLLFNGSFPFSDPETEDAASGSCKTVYTAKFLRDGEKRLTAIIRANDEKPDHRVETGVRIARFLSETIQPDLVTVQLADMHGPESRADLRGPMIGTEIVYAPNPNRSRATSQVWEVRYIDAEPTERTQYALDHVRLLGGREHRRLGGQPANVAPRSRVGDDADSDGRLSGVGHGASCGLSPQP